MNGEPAFLLQVLLSFLVSGTWIAGSTWLAERSGSRIGGLIGNLPSKLLVATVFIALVQSPAFAVEASRAVPIGMLVNAVFLFLFVLLAPHGLRVALPLSLLAWFTLALGAGRLRIEHFGLGVLLFLAVTAVAYGMLEFVLRIPEVAGNRKAYGPGSLALRGLFGGGLVALTVLLSSYVGSYWTGLIAVFPAVMLSTMTILTLAGGPGLARATGKVMLLASTNIIVFTGVVILTFPKLGVAVGTFLAYAAAALWVGLLNPLARRWATPAEP